VSLYDLNEFFGCELPEDEDYDTVAGLLFDRIGHIPRRGETLAADGVTIEVLEADDRRVQRVRILRNAPTHAGAESA
jgi:CBS domain containing-hemolysin-like protein